MPSDRKAQRWQTSGRDAPSFALVDAPPVAEPGTGEVLVEIEAVSLNYRDLLLAKAAREQAFVPGSEFCGRIADVGPGVTRFRVGDRAISTDVADWIDGPAPPVSTQSYTRTGYLSHFVIADPEHLVGVPQEFDPVDAAALPCAGLTAWMALVELGHVRAGSTILVQGTGGVATFAIQLALAHGARVIVTTSSATKAARLAAMGPVDVIDRSIHPEWQRRAMELAGPRGIDHILEMAGGRNLARSLEALAIGGRISLIGLLDEHEFTGSTGLMLFKRATLAGIGVGPRRALEDFVRASARLALRPIIDTVYDFNGVPAAFAHLEAGAFGKLVIDLRNS